MFISLKILSLLFVFTSGYLTDNKELRRQYDDYRKIHNKPEIPYGFETFTDNLQYIEYYNKNNNECRMYLTQHSDTYENEYVHLRCGKDKFLSKKNN